MSTQRPDDVRDLIGGGSNGPLLLVAGALMLAPAILPGFLARLGAWLTAHGILVPAEHAWLVIPLIGAGLDATRAGLTALVVFAALAAARARNLSKQRQAGAPR